MNYLKDAIFFIVVILIFSSCQDIKKKISYRVHKDRVDFVKSNINNPESAKILTALMVRIEKNITIALFDNLEDSIKKTENGLLVSKFITLNKNPRIGERFVDFEMKTTNNQLVSFLI